MIVEAKQGWDQEFALPEGQAGIELCHLKAR